MCDDDFETDPDEDFEPDYVEDFELGPERPRYPKASPALPIAERVAAFRYMRRMEKFVVRLNRMLTPGIGRNGRLIHRAALGRVSDKYFTFVFQHGHQVVHDSTEDPFKYMLAPLGTPRIIAKAGLYHENAERLRTKIKDLQTLHMQGHYVCVMLGEAFFCTNMETNFNESGMTTTVELNFMPDTSLYATHNRLRSAEKRIKQRFQKFTRKEPA